MTQEKPTPEQWQKALDNEGLIFRHLNRRQFVTEEDRDDAYQGGMLGLVRAAQKFDPTLGYTFATYADAWISQGIARAHMDRKPIDRMKRVGETYLPPLSTAVPLAGTVDGPTLDDVLVSNEPDEDAVTTELDRQDRFGWVLCQLRAGNIDDIDRAIIDEIEQGGRSSGRVFGNRYGITGEAVRRRRIKIRERAAALYEVYGEGR